LIQEFIPGERKQMFNIVLDKKGQLNAVVASRRLRNFARVNPHLPTARESTIPHSYVTQAANVVQHLGWWGGTTVQTKIDSRDGIPKLMEINPRLGYQLWTRTELGINEP
jgi:predicted ATP-grasp superfamily ATP-dependent carboligase